MCVLFVFVGWELLDINEVVVRRGNIGGELVDFNDILDFEVCFVVVLFVVSEEVEYLDC